MKNIKKYVMGLVAMTIAIGTVTLMSMGLEKEVKVEKKEKVSTVFHYNSEDVSEGAFANPDNWAEGPTPINTPCGGPKVKPCEKVAEDSEELYNSLAGKSNADILSDMSFTHRQ